MSKKVKSNGIYRLEINSHYSSREDLLRNREPMYIDILSMDNWQDKHLSLESIDEILTKGWDYAYNAKVTVNNNEVSIHEFIYIDIECKTYPDRKHKTFKCLAESKLREDKIDNLIS